MNDSRETKLKTYEALLHKWQKAINLVSPATLNDSWNRHFADSLQLAGFIPEGTKTLYDLGSGAGFPGLVLAILRPDLKVTLLESDQKKCIFLQNVSRETGTPVQIETMRIEQAAESLPAPEIITARALASLPDLLLLIRPWVEKNPGILCIFPKGAQYASEIKAAQAVAQFDVQEYPSTTDPAARILVLQKIVFI